MNDSIANSNVLDSDRHLPDVLGAIEVQDIDVNDFIVLGVVGNIGTCLILDSQTMHGHTDSSGIDRTEIEIETLHNRILLFILVIVVDFSFQSGYTLFNTIYMGQIGLSVHMDRNIGALQSVAGKQDRFARTIISLDDMLGCFVIRKGGLRSQSNIFESCLYFFQGMVITIFIFPVTIGVVPSVPIIQIEISNKISKTSITEY